MKLRVAALCCGAALAGRAAEDAGAALREGHAAIAARDAETAAAAFGRACALNPKEADACYFAGRTLHMLGRFEEARRAFDQALAHAPERARPRVHRAAALNFLGLGRPAEAEAQFRAAVRAYPDDAPGTEDPRVDYGAFLVRQGRTAEALPLLEQAVKSKPGSPRAQAELGRALLDGGKPEAAAASLQRAVALDPSAWAIRLLLGRVYRQLGRLEDAERELQLGKRGWSSHEKAGTPAP